MAKKYTEEELLEELKRVSEEHCDGETPRAKDMNEYGKYSEKPYLDRFGKWNNGIEKAGFEVYTPDKIYSEQEILEDIHRVSEEHCNGMTPTKEDMDEYSKFGNSIFDKRFNGWNDALREAGYSPNQEIDISDEKLFRELKKVAEKCNRDSPRQEDMNKHGKYSERPYRERFGSWNDALREAGFRASTDYNRKEIIDEIHRVSEKCGGRPRRKDMQKYGKISAVTISKRFNSWNNALKEAGFEPRELKAVGEEHFNWKGGVEPMRYGGRWYSNRRQVRERDGYACRICSLKTERNPQVHHITPARFWKIDEEFQKMNHPRNLICLCPSCHGELEGMFKGRNHEEFEELAKDYLDIADEPAVRSAVKDSIFAY